MGSQAGMLKILRAHFDSFEEIWLFIQIFLLAAVLPFLLELTSGFSPEPREIMAKADYFTPAYLRHEWRS